MHSKFSRTRRALDVLPNPRVSEPGLLTSDSWPSVFPGEPIKKLEVEEPLGSDLGEPKKVVVFGYIAIF